MARPVLLLTRPRQASLDFAASLGEGVAAEVVIAPLIAIEPVGEVPGLDGFAGVIVTSGHAVARLGKALRGRQVFTVGEQTAEAAAAFGANAHCLGATVDAFIDRIEEVATPAIYLHGQHVSSDIEDVARARGLDVSAQVIYDQVPCPMQEDALRAVRSGRGVVAPVFSRRSADLLIRALAGSAQRPVFVAISDAVGERLAGHGEVAVAETPDAGAMRRAVLEVIGTAGLAGGLGALRL
jgi:uroporphyrinogen-III synthase